MGSAVDSVNLKQNLIDLHNVGIGGVEIAPIYGVKGEEDNFIDKLTQIVTNDLSKKWIIDDLAYMFGMGKTKFTYEVKKHTGYPPNSFIINLKIEKAIDLIKNNKAMNMSDIAFTCGFSSLQHFTATFSQRIGVSPSKYEK